MLFYQKIGGGDGGVGNINYSTRSVECLTPKQTKYIYKKVELGSLINKETIKEEIDLDAELDRVDDGSRDENPCKELIINNAVKIESTLSQMEQWLILSNVINYVQYSKNPKDFHAMTVRPVNNKNLNTVSKIKNKGDISLEVDLTDSLHGLQEKYLDKYEGVISEILNTTRFDENTDLNTTYLGKLRMT